ncbi:hypothetical protein K435DRAFT_784528 [Dendrothele bispora CBS 962.96]|uniref:Uncharacterized protein n=1 Tax=Dendrothele bispora (strain CBS 962.96) TaxID=1314807 RepID=A0A4S8L2I9_DENBC|nr:hypothetical protein K435DRAFT_785907 [Dendrothele bispora CBS 962.96]THU82657.1 hypothetical protein K435DRAFT_784528 [Dendrothele bispora CBS 962.96]
MDMPQTSYSSTSCSFVPSHPTLVPYEQFSIYTIPDPIIRYIMYVGTLHAYTHIFVP